MTKQKSIIKFQDTTFDLSKIKAGIQRKDIEALDNKFLLSLFDCLDKEDKNGLKNKVLDEDETKDFINKILDYAGNNKLSEKEAKSLLQSYGLEETKSSDLFNLLTAFIDKSKEILSFAHNKDKTITVEYEEGYINVINSDGSKQIKAKESIDKSLKTSFDYNTKFCYMKDIDRNREIQRDLEETLHKANIDKIFERNGYDKSNVKIEEYCSRETPEDFKGTIFEAKPDRQKRTYFDNEGNPILIAYCNKEGDVIYDIEYFENNQWIEIDYQPRYGSHSVSIKNKDKSQLLTESVFYKGNLLNLKVVNPNTKRFQETRYDYITGKTKSITDVDELGRKIKYQCYDENEELLYTEVPEYIGNSQDYNRRKIYDKNNNLIKILVEKEDGGYDEYDPNGNLITEEDSNDGLMHYGGDFIGYFVRNWNSFEDKIRNSFDAPETKGLIGKQIEIFKQDLNNVHLGNFNQGSIKTSIKEKMINELDSLQYSNDREHIISTLSNYIFKRDEIVKAYTKASQTETIPDKVIDKVTYQGDIGDCWLLSPTNGISEVKEGGKEYIESLFEKDDEGNPVVKLMGGKIKYSITPEEYEQYANFSEGDPTLRLIEIAFDKYAKEFGINGSHNLHGNWEKYAFQVYSGNEPVEAIRKDGKLGVFVNGEFIEINEQNADKLKHIPITIEKIQKEDLTILASLKKRTAIGNSSFTQHYGGHAFYIKNINKNSVQIKEPHNTANIATYEKDDYITVYGDKPTTLFIL